MMLHFDLWQIWSKEYILSWKIIFSIAFLFYCIRHYDKSLSLSVTRENFCHRSRRRIINHDTTNDISSKAEETLKYHWRNELTDHRKERQSKRARMKGHRRHKLAAKQLPWALVIFSRYMWNHEIISPHVVLLCQEEGIMTFHSLK